MEIVSLFTSPSRGRSLNDAVGLMIETRAKAIAARTMKRLEKNAKKISSTWQASTQVLLNRNATGIQNNTPNPFLRTGLLRASINEPVPVIDKLEGIKKGSKYRVKFARLFEARIAQKSTSQLDVGKYLNSQKYKSFGGWQTRARRNLLDALKKGILSKGTLNG